MGKGFAYTLGMISVFGLAVACQSGKSSHAATVNHSDPQLPNPQFDSSLQTRGVQKAGTSTTTRTSIVTLKCVDNGGPQCDVMKIMEMQREANIIFNQAWKAIFKTTDETLVADVSSIFQVTLSQMKQLYRADGEKVTASAACNKTRPVFENLSTKLQTQYVLSVADCQNLNRRKEIVTFQKTTKDQWTLTYATNNMPKSAVGSSLQFLGKPVVCKASMNENLKISALSCTGLGQSTPASVTTSSDAFTEFTTFNFSGMSTANILQVSGAKNRSTQDHEAPTFNMSVPVNGPILYNEKIIVQETITQEGPSRAEVSPTPTTMAQQNQTQQVVAGAEATAALRHKAPWDKNEGKNQNPEQQKLQERVELLSVLTEEDRKLFDTSKPEDQEAMLQQLREEKAQAEAAKAQVAQTAGGELQQNEQNANLPASAAQESGMIMQGSEPLGQDGAVQAQDAAASVR